jgi:hypothetical protein
MIALATERGKRFSSRKVSRKAMLLAGLRAFAGWPVKMRVRGRGIGVLLIRTLRRRGGYGKVLGGRGNKRCVFAVMVHCSLRKVDDGTAGRN